MEKFCSKLSYINFVLDGEFLEIFCRHVKDLIILTAITQGLAIFTDYMWLIMLLVSKSFWYLWAGSYNRVLKCDVIKIKFVKLWDFSWYYEGSTSKRPTCQKLAFQGKVSDSVHKISNRVKFRRICTESSEQNGTSIFETIWPTF